jgi:hypothetical protein
METLNVRLPTAFLVRHERQKCSHCYNDRTPADFVGTNLEILQSCGICRSNVAKYYMENKEKIYERNKTQCEAMKRIYCEDCGSYIKPYSMKAHLETKCKRARGELLDEE